MKAYHYSDKKIENIDFALCNNGFFATSISPDMLEDHGAEIGFQSAKFCLIIEISEDFEYALVEQDTAEQEIQEACAGYGELRYDNGDIEWSDYVFFSEEAITSTASIEL